MTTIDNEKYREGLKKYTAGKQMPPEELAKANTEVAQALAKNFIDAAKAYGAAYGLLERGHTVDEQFMAGMLTGMALAMVNGMPSTPDEKLPLQTALSLAELVAAQAVEAAVAAKTD